MSLSLFKDEKCALFFRSLGLAVFIYTLVKICAKLFNNIGTFFFGLGKVNLKKYGSWSVVTGCTDGIGKAYAEHLAKRGLNVVLISRSLDKLKDQAKYLEEKYSVQTKVVAADFTEPNTIYDGIRAALVDLDIAVLVNNVGMSYKYSELFLEYSKSEKFLNDLIICNIFSVTKMTAIVLPGMVSRKSGVIINNASSLGRFIAPLFVLYSSSKAYVDIFSRSLNLEYKSKGIIVQSLCPFFVRTKLSTGFLIDYQVLKDFFCPSPDQFVSNAINTIGSQSVTNGCLAHSLQGWLLECFLPTSIFNNIFLSVMEKLKELRFND